MLNSGKYDIPWIIEDMYYHCVEIPPQESWPDYLSPDNPQLAHGLYAFRQGLSLGFQLADACREG